VDVSFRCMVCGYRLEKKIAFPIEALYLIRGLLKPNVQVEVEKIYYASLMRRQSGGTG